MTVGQRSDRIKKRKQLAQSGSVEGQKAVISEAMLEEFRYSAGFSKPVAWARPEQEWSARKNPSGS